MYTHWFCCCPEFHELDDHKKKKSSVLLVFVLSDQKISDYRFKMVVPGVPYVSDIFII